MNLQYDKYTTISRQIDDCTEGEWAVKAKGQTYLPSLSGMQEAQDGNTLYDVFLSWAKFFPATGRTLDAFIGSLFRKTPQNNLEAINTDLVSNFTDDGNTAEGCARDLSSKLMRNGLAALLVDFPAVEGTEGLTVRDVEDMNIKPYVTTYDIYAIKDWHYSKRYGRKILTKVTLQEHYELIDVPYTLPKTVKIVDNTVTLLRELTLDKIGYKQTILVMVEKNKENEEEFVVLDSFYPLRNGVPLKFIPIVPVSNHGLVFEYDYPLLYDLSRVNFCDYRTDALYRNSLFYIGRPTPCVAGLKPFEDEDKAFNTLTLGPSTFLEFEQGGNAWMLGGDPNSCKALQEELTRLKQEMSVIGSRSLAADPNGVESARTATIHRIGEIGTLNSVAAVVSSAMRRTLYYILYWRDTNVTYFEEDIEYTIMTDFIPEDVNPALLSSLFEQYLRGNIPLEVLFYNLRKTEVIPDTMTIDSFKAGLPKKEVVQPMVEIQENVVNDNINQ